MKWRARLSRLLRLGFLVLAVALLLYGAAGRWGTVRPALGRLGVFPVVGSLAAVLLGLYFSALAWRALLADLGAPLPSRAALRVFFVGQLGKYLPGSVWPVVAQMELGRDHGASRERVGAAALLVMGLNVTTGLLLAAVLLPFVSQKTFQHYTWALAVLPLGLLALHPRVLTSILDVGLRLLRRPPLEVPLTWGGVGATVAWTLAMWTAYGAHVWVLAAALDGHGAVMPVLATAGFATAWTIGFLLVVAPAGVGPREVALVLALSVALPQGAATAVALVSRLLMTLGDLLWAGLALGKCPHGARTRPGDERDGTGDNLTRATRQLAVGSKRWVRDQS